MNSAILFRILLVASILIALLGGAIPVFELYETTEDLEIILMWNGYGGLSPLSDGQITGPLDVTVLVLFGILIIALIVGSIGAFFFKKWGRILLAVTAIISILTTPAFGLFVALPIEMLFYELSGAAFYIALAMTFLPPLRYKFEKNQ